MESEHIFGIMYRMLISIIRPTGLFDFSYQLTCRTAPGSSDEWRPVLGSSACLQGISAMFRRLTSRNVGANNWPMPCVMMLQERVQLNLVRVRTREAPQVWLWRGSCVGTRSRMQPVSGRDLLRRLGRVDEIMIK
jgi:hypothetical protein